MSTINQKNIHVGTVNAIGGDYYAASGDINFAAVKSKTDFAAELDKLKQELTRAREQNVIDEDTETLTKGQLVLAAKEAKAPEPDKKTLLSHLDTAKDCLKGIAAAGTIIELLTKAGEWVQGMF